MMMALSVLMSTSTMFAVQSYPPVISYVMTEFKLSYGQASLLMSFPSMMGVFLALPVGFMIVRWGFRRIGGLGLLLSTMGAAFAYLGPSFLWITLGRIVMGVGNNLANLTSFVMIPIWFTKDDIGKATGIKSLDMPIATATALNFLPRLADTFGWRVSFLVPVIILAFTTTTFLLVAKERDKVKQQIVPLKALKNRQAWLLGIIFSFWNMGFSSYLTWGGTFFVEMKGISNDFSFFLVSLITLMMIPLSPVSGILSDKFGRKIFALLSSLATFISFLFIPYLILPLLLLPILTLSFANSFLPAPLLSLQSKVLPAEIAGLSFGIFSTCISAGSALGPYLTGLTRDVFPNNASVFFIMAIFFLLVFLCSSFLKVRR